VECYVFCFFGKNRFFELDADQCAAHQHMQVLLSIMRPRGKFENLPHSNVHVGVKQDQKGKPAVAAGNCLVLSTQAFKNIFILRDRVCFLNNLKTI
jgi:hypothetical protein